MFRTYITDHWAETSDDPMVSRLQKMIQSAVVITETSGTSDDVSTPAVQSHPVTDTNSDVHKNDNEYETFQILTHSDNNRKNSCDLSTKPVLLDSIESLGISYHSSVGAGESSGTSEPESFNEIYPSTNKILHMGSSFSNSVTDNNSSDSQALIKIEREINPEESVCLLSEDGALGGDMFSIDGEVCIVGSEVVCAVSLPSSEDGGQSEDDARRGTFEVMQSLKFILGIRMGAFLVAGFGITHVNGSPIMTQTCLFYH